MNLFTIALILFLIMDPIGNASSFEKTLHHTPAARHRYIILREMAIALAVMLLFAFLGDWIFYFLQLTEVSLNIASGIVLFLTAIAILFSYDVNPRAKVTEDEPFIIPLAIPLIAGPSLLATILLYAHLDQTLWRLLVAIVLAWLPATLIVFFSKELLKLLGEGGLQAVEKLMGMVLVLLAIERFTEGIILFIQESGAAAAG